MAIEKMYVCFDENHPPLSLLMDFSDVRKIINNESPMFIEAATEEGERIIINVHTIKYLVHDPEEMQ